MFTNINKKIVIVSVIFFVLLLTAGFFGYQYYSNISSQTPQSINENNTTENETQSQNNQDDVGAGIEVITGNGGGLTICSDKCGDGICQKEQTACDNLNCICQENIQECPLDCK